MKVLGVIPARGGSKGVPRKNIKLLCGKPLIKYTIDAAIKSKQFEELIVSTEDEEIATIAKHIGASVPFLRPLHLAADNTPTIDIVIDILNTYKDRGKYFDVICLLQPTNPLRSIHSIKKSINDFYVSGADSLISVREVPHKYNPHWLFTEAKDSRYLSIATGEKNIIPRRQELPKAYYRDGSIYLTKSSILLEKKSLYGEKISFINMKNENYINIDTMEDWAEAERLLCAE